MILVNVYCEVRGCKAGLLAAVSSAPAANDEQRWTDYVWLPICPRHGGGHGSVAKWVAAQLRLGRTADRVPVGRWIPWSALRPFVEQARRTGETATCAL